MLRTDLGGAPDDETSTDSLTGTGAIIGTSGYMSPEQARGQPADPRSDIFALGATLYEMLTGIRTFQRGSFIDTLQAILTEDPPPMSLSGREIPLGVETLVRHCLEKSPEERFQTARDLAFALSTAVGGEPRIVSSRTPGNQVTGINRRLWLAIGAALFTVVLAVLTTVVIRRVGKGVDGSKVTYERLTAQRGHIYNARFAADGKAVLYSATWDGKPIEVFETRAGQKVSRSLDLPPMNLLSISRDGMMAVTLGDEFCILHPTHTSTLATVPTSGGSPRALMDSVMSACWMPNSETLAVARVVGTKTRVECPPGKILYESVGDVRHLDASPMGTMLAFLESLSRWSDGEIVIVDMTGRILSKTSHLKEVTGLAWSADGAEIVFSSMPDMVATELVAMRPKGEQRIMVRMPGTVVLYDIAPDGGFLIAQRENRAGMRGRGPRGDEERELGFLDWSATADLSLDGERVLFSEQIMGGGATFSVYIRDLDGSPPVKLGDGEPWTFSPDGKWVVVSQGTEDEHLVLLPTGPGSERKLPRGPIKDFHRLYRPRWLPDSKSIVFNGAEEGHVMRAYLQDIDGGLPQPITPPGYVQQLVAPDGAYVVAGFPGGSTFLCPIAGGEPIPIGEIRFQERTAQFTPDGQAIYCYTMGRSMEVSLLDLQTGERRPWRTFQLPDPSGAMMMGYCLTPDASAYVYCYSRLTDCMYLMTSR